MISVNKNPDLSLQALENRFLIVSDNLQKIRFEYFPPPDKSDIYKIYQHPIFPTLKLRWTFSFAMGDAGHCDAFIVVEPKDTSLNHLFLVFYFPEQAIWRTQFSLTANPRVWERVWTFGPDFVDYVHVQKMANYLCKIMGRPEFSIDRSKEGKSVAVTIDGSPSQYLELRAESVEVTELD